MVLDDFHHGLGQGLYGAATSRSRLGPGMKDLVLVHITGYHVYVNRPSQLVLNVGMYNKLVLLSRHP